MNTITLFAFLVTFSLACANTVGFKNVKTQLKDDDWRSELLEGDCSNIMNFDNLLTKLIDKDEGSGIVTDEVQYSGSRTVQCIVVTNLMTDGTGGYVAIVGGGVGQYNVELKFRSQANKGLQFQVDVYGL